VRLTGSQQIENFLCEAAGLWKLTNLPPQFSALRFRRG
jgi:hypothetical protein